MYVCGRCKVRRADNALQLIREASSKHDHVQHRHQWTLEDTEAQTLLDEMISVGCPFSVSTYNCVIVNLCRSREMEKAMDVFLYMRKKKCEAASVLDLAGTRRSVKDAFWKKPRQCDARGLREDGLPSNAQDIRRVVDELGLCSSRLGESGAGDGLSWAALAYGVAQKGLVPGRPP
ncbi:hypothetical protein SELMODRAFT_418651 [Selaginella moellendorffii]|uniref:Pentacotripeptide-repeat region of PRORP domain-containing protein n=1 Tax=Selaginella moellendorffii TaxID=88036 RepID=D8S6Q3_SELML|nr:hypothetical protein SELMODRAFT_418651 [Selaginella moellendorffii]